MSIGMLGFFVSTIILTIGIGIISSKLSQERRVRRQLEEKLRKLQSSAEDKICQQ